RRRASIREPGHLRGNRDTPTRMAMDNFTMRAPGLGRRGFLAGALGLTALGGLPLLGGCGVDSGSARAPEGPPRIGGRLRSVIAGRSASSDVLDPHTAGSSAGGAVAKNVWDKLVAYNNDLTPRHRLARELRP